MGLYNHHKQVEQPPAVVPASDMCGIVVAVGPSSNNTTDPYKNPAFALKEGDRVVSTFAQTHITGQVQARDMGNGLGNPLPGVLTQYRVFPTYGLLKVPDYLSFDEAACFPRAKSSVQVRPSCAKGPVVYPFLLRKSLAQQARKSSSHLPLTRSSSARKGLVPRKPSTTVVSQTGTTRS